MKKLNPLPYVALVFGASAVAASAVAPIDMATVGAELAGYVPDAAEAGLLVLAGVLAVRIIIKGFRAVIS